MIHQAATQMNPIAPVKMNASCQPHVEGEPGNDEGRDDRAHVGAGVEDARCERTLLLGEPLRHRLDGGGEVPALGEAEKGAGDGEAGDRTHEGMPHRGDAPPEDGDGVALPHADPIIQPPHQQVTERVREAEPGDDVRRSPPRTSELRGERRRQDAQDRAVHVVDRGGSEQERADHPAIAADPSTSSCVAGDLRGEGGGRRAGARRLRGIRRYRLRTRLFVRSHGSLL